MITFVALFECLAFQIDQDCKAILLFSFGGLMLSFALLSATPMRWLLLGRLDAERAYCTNWSATWPNSSSTDVHWFKPRTS